MVADPTYGNVALMTYNMDGTAMYGVIQTPGAPVVVKSTDHGRTWKSVTPAVNPFGGAGFIMDIEVSSMYPNHVYVTDGFDIFKTEDGGTTWVLLSNLFTSLPTATGWIASIDVGYLGTNPYIFAGTSTWGGLTGGVYVAAEAVYGMPWSDMLVGTDRAVALPGADVTEVVVDPAFGTTQMVMAVVNIGPGGIVITSKYAGQQWAQTAADVPVPAVGPVLGSDLFLPSTFSSSVASANMQVFLGFFDMAASGDVFLCIFGNPTSVAFDLNVAGPASVFQCTGLDGAGTWMLAAGETAAAPGVPAVYRSTNGGSNWQAALKAPTGGAGPSGFTDMSVLITDAATGEAIASTFGAGSGIYLTQNFGVTWNGMSLLNVVVGTIQDIAFYDGLVCVLDGAYLWRHDGSQWLLMAATAADCINVAPDGTIFTSVFGGAAALMFSSDAGDTWATQVSSLPGGALWNAKAALDASTLVAADQAGGVYTTSNNGVIWFTRTNPGGVIDRFAVNGDMVLAGTAVGEVLYSADKGVTWTKLGTPGTGSMYVAFAMEDGVYYATDMGGGMAWRYDSNATTPAFQQVDNVAGAGASVAGAAVVSGVGIAAGAGGPGGMIYAMDADGGVTRHKCPAGQAPANVASELIASQDIADTWMGMWVTDGSKLWSVNVTDNKIYTYTDTLAVFGTGATITYTQTSATVTWDAIPNATGYRVTWGTASIGRGTGGIFFSQAHASNVGSVDLGNVTTYTIAGLAPATTYYVRIWGLLPVSTFHINGDREFATLPGTPVYTPNLMPPDGAFNVPTTVAFAWDPVPGATSYEWQLATDSGYANIIATESPTVPHLVYGPLDYSTSFFWRVRAVTDAGTSPWVASVFSTEEAADPPVTVTQTSTTTTEVTEEITPMYIWVIIIIGAILTIAVIVLIVRTRRVV
jgi:photosystem II stability/assembly factor-like uncharacterized protein